MIHFQPLSQAGSQALGEGPGLVGSSGPIGGGNDGADVSQVDLGDSGQGRVGPVVPFGCLQHGSELLGQRQDRLRLDLRELLGGCFGVHSLDGLAHARHTGLQHFSSQRLLVIGKGCQCSLAMDPLRLEAGGSGPGTLRPPAFLRAPVGGSPVAAVGTLRPAVPVAIAGIVGPGIPLGSLGPARLALLAVAAVAVCSLVSTAATAAVRVVAGVPAIAPAIPVVVAVAASGLPDQRGCHRRAVPAADQLQTIRGRGPDPRRGHRDDLETVEPAVGFGLEHGADSGCVRNEVTAHLALGLACTGGPPGPSAVGALAGQLDL